MGGLSGSLEGGPGERLELDDVAGLTGLFPGGLRGSLGATGDDGPCPWNRCLGNIETHQNCLVGGQILPTVAYSLDISCVRKWLVANCCVSC